MKKIPFELVSYYSLLLFAFSMPLSKASNSFFVFWLLLLVLFKGNYKSSWNTLKENKIFLYIALFVGYMYLSAFWSSDTQKALSYLRMQSYWILIPSFVLLAKKEWIYSILNFFLLGMLLSEILAYGIFFELWSINGRGPEYPSPFMMHIHYSVFLAFTSLILLYRFLFEESSWKVRLPMFVFFLMTTTNLMISTGRTGQLAFFLTLFVVFFIRYKISIKTFFISILVMSSIVFTSYNTLSLFQKRADMAISDIKKISQHNFNSSFGLRAAWWIVTYDALQEKPLFGYGLGSHKVASNQMLNKHDYKGLSKPLQEFLVKSHFHNQYLMIAVQGGLVGLFLFFLLLYKMYRLKMEDRELKHLSIIGLSVLAISFIPEPLFLLQFPLMLFLFIMALFITASKKQT